ncbi:unnamed protein product [Amoebophrya sp. A25]|nr:unnamed protein product [Amoebophrya sp. A25]|eukprot:GSA25T00020170001.1
MAPHDEDKTLSQAALDVKMEDVTSTSRPNATMANDSDTAAPTTLIRSASTTTTRSDARTSSTCVEQQATLTARELYGGAISCSVFASFDDVSCVRQIPDNQEVFVDRVEGADSLIVELLDMAPVELNPRERVGGGQATLSWSDSAFRIGEFHLSDLIAAASGGPESHQRTQAERVFVWGNGEARGEGVSTETSKGEQPSSLVSTTYPFPSLEQEGRRSDCCAVILSRQENVEKHITRPHSATGSTGKGEGQSLRGSTKEKNVEDVWTLLACVRYEAFRTDVLLSLNCSVRRTDERGASNADMLIEQAVEGQQLHDASNIVDQEHASETAPASPTQFETGLLKAAGKLGAPPSVLSRLRRYASGFEKMLGSFSIRDESLFIM